MTLLDLLSKERSLELVVAHFNHGIRDDSLKDAELVRQKAEEYGQPFEVGYGNLGAGASEAEARAARYTFLREIQQKHEAISLITAHHQDDLIETALINIIRGTGPKGLIAISTNRDVMRPLLGHRKSEILNYARINNLLWLEDSSNQDNSYLRNYVRNELLPKMSAADRKQILTQIKKIEAVHIETESVIAKISQKVLIDELTVNRSTFISLPPDVATSFLVFWLKSLNVADLDKRTIWRLANALKTAPAGSQHELRNGKHLKLTKKEAHFSI